MVFIGLHATCVPYVTSCTCACIYMHMYTHQVSRLLTNQALHVSRLDLRHNGLGVEGCEVIIDAMKGTRTAAFSPDAVSRNYRTPPTQLRMRCCTWHDVALLHVA
jgi:hypothetical protein